MISAIALVFILKGIREMALGVFLKQNKKASETVKYAASSAFQDSDGKTVEWEIKPLKSKEAEKIRNQCTNIGKGGKVTTDMAKFNRLIAVSCTVYPNLNDAELQDSYGVMGADNLIVEMLDTDGEYQSYVKKCMEISGYDKNDAELVIEAKN